MKKSYIKTTQDLENFCERSKHQVFLSIDTEFVRERTYWPLLCLIQIATDTEVVLIDPLTNGISLDPLKALLYNPNILKIIHAGRQDLEIFYHLWQAVPFPIFDTQVASMVCGLGENISYEKLVDATLQKKIDKTMQYTSWDQRPLSPRQLEYAAEDVINLQAIYQILIERAGEKIKWIEEEISILTSPRTYINLPEDAWRKIKIRSSQSPTFLGLLKDLAALREFTAQTRNVPRQRVLKDEVIIALATQMPKDEAALRNIRGLLMPLVIPMKDLLECIRKASPFTPPLSSRSSRKATESVDLLNILLKIKCEEHKVAAKIVASREDLENFLESFLTGRLDSPLLKDWRFNIIGKEALEVLKGKIGIGLGSNERLKIIHLNP